MKETKQTIALVAKVIAGIGFLGVFILNVMLFVNTDKRSFSLETLKAYAQTGGSGNEEETSTNTLYAQRKATLTTDVVNCQYLEWDDVNNQFYIKNGTQETVCYSVECIGSGSEGCAAEPLTCITSQCM